MGYPLVNIQKAIFHMAIEIVDFPYFPIRKKCDFPVRYVSLPEGKTLFFFDDKSWKASTSPCGPDSSWRSWAVQDQFLKLLLSEE